MKKFIAESLNEWITNTTAPKDFELTFNKNQDIQDIDLTKIVPPATIKLTVSDAESFIEKIVDIIPEDPNFAYAVFNTLVKTHPYMLRKTVGFHSYNPYENVLNTFLGKFYKYVNKFQ